MSIISKLVYGLQTAVLLVTDRRKLNGFYCKCLRQILEIRPSFYSRVSNQQVLERAGVSLLSRKIEEAQALLFGKIARLDNSSCLRQFCFEPDSFTAKVPVTRRRGRPRLSWINLV